MCISDFKAAFGITLQSRGVSGNLRCLDGVGNLLPIRIAVKVFDRRLPGILIRISCRCSQFCRSCFLTVRQNLHFELIRTESIPVVIIFPTNRQRDGLDLLCLMGIRDSEAVFGIVSNLCGISGNLIFSYAVDNRRPICFCVGKSGKCDSPVFFLTGIIRRIASVSC